MQKLDTMLFVRVSKALKQRFVVKALRYGTPATVHRELISAFVEDRLTITPPTDKESLHEPRS